MNQQPMQNNRKINRVLYIVTVTLLFAIAVVIAITTAANRREKNPEVPDTSDTVLETELESDDTTAPITTDREKDAANTPDTSKEPQTSDTDASADEPAEPVVSLPPKFNLPTVGILSKKHDTSLQVYSATMNDYRVHNGIDIVTEEGAPVYAAADGTVSQVWEDPLMGNCIAISHSGECYTVYKNLAEEIAAGIEAGVNVSAGQLIASVGNTAMIEIAEEPHLHFEMTVAGEAANPLDYFDESALVSLTIDASYES
ncbi:MAG: M23 family metallopeptidase [Clostridia bacterium]|nr:M23 family metallopeptidase [Clostridia bacterium]